MEKTLIINRRSYVEMTPDNDSSRHPVASLGTQQSVASLSEAVQGVTASLETSADSALRPKHNPADGKGLDETKTHYISWQSDYLDTHFDRIGTDGGTKTKEPSCSPTSILARQMSHRLSPEDETTLDPTAVRVDGVQPEKRKRLTSY